MNEGLVTIVNQNGEDTAMVESDAQIIAPMTQDEYDRQAAMLDEIDQYDEATEVSSSYWEAVTQGESIKGIFVGMKVLTKTDSDTGEMKNIPAAVVLTKNGSRLLGSTSVVDTFLTSVPDGSAVKVTYTGKKGRAKMFKVEILKKSK